MLQLKDNNHLSSEIQACIKNCLECHNVCLQTISYCIEASPRHSDLIRSLLSCAEICRLNANFMLLESEYQRELLQVCESASEKAASICDGKAGGNFQLKLCAEICRVTSSSCAVALVGIRRAS